MVLPLILVLAACQSSLQTQSPPSLYRTLPPECRPIRHTGFLLDRRPLLNPLVVRVMGANINRRTVENVRKAGLTLEQVEDLGAGGIFKFIVARVEKAP